MHRRSDRETPERRRPPRLAALVGALALTLAVAACGGGNHPSGVASLGASGQPTATTAANGRQDPRQAALAWARCMRQNGINMPDPQITGSGGNLNITQDGPIGVNKKDPRVKTAQDACQHYLARGSAGGSNGSDPRQHQRELQFARCMRQHGVHMSDPRPDGGFTTEGDDKDSPAIKAAERACEHYLAGGKGSGR
jgi:hypothetical protein